MAAFRIFRRLADLLDVQLGSPADGDALVYDGGSSRWVADAVAGGGGAPSGAAGGVLGGTYPNPSFAADMATQVELDAEASTRSGADSTLTTAISTEASARASAVSGLSLVYQPLDSDLTAIAALSTTSFGRAVLALADQAALLAAAGAAAASHAHSGADITSGTVVDARIDAAIARDTEVTSAIAALSSVYQPLDSDLTAIAALTTTTYGRAFLALADAAAGRTALGLVIGTDVAAFGDSRLSDSRAPSGSAGGDLTGTYPNPTVASGKITEAKMVLADNTTGNVSTSAHGFAPKAPNDATKYLDGAGAYSVPVGSGYAPGGTDVAVADGGTGASTAAAARTNLGLASVAWDAVVVKAVDESVASSTTVQNDDDLFFTAVNGAVYWIDLFIVYGSPLSAGSSDLKFDLGEDSTTRGIFGFAEAAFTTADVALATALVANQTATLSIGTAVVDRGALFTGVYSGAGGTFRFRWAQAISLSGATIVRAGSFLRYRRIN